MMNNQDKYKMPVFTDLAHINKALSSDKRLMILHLLFQAPKAVETIAIETGMSIANTSRHLQILKKNGLVKSIKDKNYVVYSLANYKIADLLNDLIDIDDDQGMQNSVDSKKGVRTITLTEAKKIAFRSCVLDARPQDEYQHGHIEGAINIPYTQINENLQKLPYGKPIIVYCRGRLCGITNQVTQELNEKGFEAYSLNNSFLDWISN